MTFSFKHLALAVATTALLTACGGDNASSGSAPAEQPTANDEVKTRQNTMKDWRGANDIMKSMLENPASFDQATFLEQAQYIQSSTAQTWSAFSDANNKGKSQDAVWSDAEGFQAQKDLFDEKITALVEVATNAQSADDVQAAFGAMAETCGSCHKVYKQ